MRLVVPKVFDRQLQGIRDEGVRLAAISPGGRHVSRARGVGIKRMLHEVGKEVECRLRVRPRLECGADNRLDIHVLV